MTEKTADLFQEEDTQKGKHLIFALGNEQYGIPIGHVIEIIGIQPITEVPEQPEYVKGVINLRGKIIPVMDVRLRFKKTHREYDDRTCIVVIEVADLCIGIVVDRVLEVIIIADENIAPPPKWNKDSYSRYVQGIGKVGDQVKILLDCKRLLDDEELLELHTLDMNEQ
jgi:purine-binding chemotaxis protein CheW